jgi:hypothetical protein
MKWPEKQYYVYLSYLYTKFWENTYKKIHIRAETSQGTFMSTLHASLLVDFFFTYYHVIKIQISKLIKGGYYNKTLHLPTFLFF